MKDFGLHGLCGMLLPGLGCAFVCVYLLSQMHPFMPFMLFDLRFCCPLMPSTISTASSCWGIGKEGKGISALPQSMVMVYHSAVSSIMV